MAMLKVNSIIAESHYNIVINKVAGNAISPLTLLTATSRETLKKKKGRKKEKDQRNMTEGTWKDDALPENTKRQDNREAEQILRGDEEKVQITNWDMTEERASTKASNVLTIELFILLRVPLKLNPPKTEWRGTTSSLIGPGNKTAFTSWAVIINFKHTGLFDPGSHNENKAAKVQ